MARFIELTEVGAEPATKVLINTDLIFTICAGKDNTCIIFCAVPQSNACGYKQVFNVKESYDKVIQFFEVIQP
jgi:hypothetical protein